MWLQHDWWGSWHLLPPPHRTPKGELLVTDVVKLEAEPSVGHHNASKAGSLGNPSDILQSWGNRHLKWLNGIQFVSDPESTLTSIEKLELLFCHLHLMSVMTCFAITVCVGVGLIFPLLVTKTNALVHNIWKNLSDFGHYAYLHLWKGVVVLKNPLFS